MWLHSFLSLYLLPMATLLFVCGTFVTQNFYVDIPVEQIKKFFGITPIFGQLTHGILYFLLIAILGFLILWPLLPFAIWSLKMRYVWSTISWLILSFALAFGASYPFYWIKWNKIHSKSQDDSEIMERTIYFVLSYCLLSWMTKTLLDWLHYKLSKKEVVG